MGFEKLDGFAKQLLSSGAIRNLSTSEKEESVHAFIRQNEQKLQVTFTSPEYFPNLPWDRVKGELLKKVGEQLSGMISPQLENLIHNHLNLSWKAQYTDFMIPEETFRDQLYNLCSKLASRFNSRVHYGKILNFMQNGVLTPFFASIYQNKRYVLNGLERYDQINYHTIEEAMGMIYTGMLFMPLFDISLPISSVVPQYNGPSRMVAFRDTESNGLMRQNFLDKIKEVIHKEFPGISPYFVKIIIRVGYQSDDIEDVPFMSKLLKISTNFAYEWKKAARERGAESFEASWLNVARINYKFYAYDLGTLDEFYKITIEEDL